MDIYRILLLVLIFLAVSAAVLGIGDARDQQTHLRQVRRVGSYSCRHSDRLRHDA